MRLFFGRGSRSTDNAAQKGCGNDDGSGRGIRLKSFPGLRHEFLPVTQGGTWHLAERREDGVPDRYVVRPELAQFREAVEVGRGVAAGELVDVMPEATQETKRLKEQFSLDGGSALRTRVWISESAEYGLAHKGTHGEPEAARPSRARMSSSSASREPILLFRRRFWLERRLGLSGVSSVMEHRFDEG